MKKILSLVLSLCVGFLSFITVAAVPARAQQVASLGSSISKLREEYERLLAVARDPETAPEVRQLNNTFLEERRAQLRAAIEARVNALRKYQTSVRDTLTPNEGEVLEGSIRDLIVSMEKLDKESRPAFAPASAARKASPTVTTAEAEPVAYTRPSRVNPLPRAAGETFTSPSKNISVEVLHKDLEGIVKVTTSDDIKKSVKIVVKDKDDKDVDTKTIKLERGLNEYTEKIKLADGKNTITVSDADKASDNVSFEWTASKPAAGGGGSGGSGGGSGGGGAATPKPVVVLTQPKDGDTEITGSVTNRPADSKLKIFIDAGEQQGDIETDGDKYLYTNVRLILRNEQIVRVQLVDKDNKPLTSVFKKVIAEGDDYRPHQAAATGLVFGGAVQSQQAQAFSQSDPFFGFIAGYRFRTFGAERRYERDANNNYKYVDAYGNVYEGDDAYLACVDAVTDRERERLTTCTKCEKDAEFRGENEAACKLCESTGEKRRSQGGCTIKRGAPDHIGRGRLHMRVMGIFTASPRTAEKKEGADDTTEPPVGSDLNFQPFITSRKSFDTEIHAWYDWPRWIFGSSDLFQWGPYVAWGASAIMDKNELQGEKIPVEEEKGTGNEGSEPENVVDGGQLQTDNDIEQYKEVGVHASALLFSRRVFIESILAYGHYEALNGLYKEEENVFANTSHRFIGKLRVFPSGLETTFGRQTKFAPMFGVDLNAGKGPDQLRFFTGFAVRIRGLN